MQVPESPLAVMRLCSCHCSRVAPQVQVLIDEAASHESPQACLRVACQSLRAELHLGVICEPPRAQIGPMQLFALL